MSARTGRPKAEVTRDQSLVLRTTKETREKLERCSKTMGTTKTAVIEHGIDLVEKELNKKEG